MKPFFAGLMTLAILAGNVIAQDSIGQNNVGFAVADKPAYATQYVTKYYRRCGRTYYYQEPVAVVAAAAAQTTSVTNPIGAVNTDNSVTHQYTYNITYAQQPYPQGSSLLGYPGSGADVYGNLDLGASLDTYTRAVAQNSADANSILGKLNDTFGQIAANQKDLAASALQGQTMMALALADAKKTEAQASLANSLKASGTSGLNITQSYKIEQGTGVQKVEPDPSNPNPQMPALPTDNLGQIQQLVTQKCISCHGAQSPKGGLNLTDIGSLTARQCEAILTRVTHPDPLKRMPLTAEGKAGEPLTVAELKLLFKSAQ